jgi:hypothetical protein
MLEYAGKLKIDTLAASLAADLRELGETGSPDSVDYASLAILKPVSGVHSILSSRKRGYEKHCHTAATERWSADAEIDRPLSIAAKEASKVAIPDLLAQFNYDQSPPLEKLLIDQIVIRWLHLAIVDYEFSLEAHRPKPPDQDTGWEKRLSLTQRRFIQACESLIRVRHAARLIPGGLFQPGPEPGGVDNPAPDSALLARHSASPETDWSMHFQEDSAIE